MSFPGLDTVLGIDWSTIGKTALGAGLGTALVQGAFTIYRDRRQRQAQSTYLAMRLVVVLDAFALDCSKLVAKNAESEPHPEPGSHNLTLTLPELGAFPDDADGWTAIDQRLASGCLTLRNSIQHAQTVLHEAAYNLWQEDDYDDLLRDVIDAQASMLAMKVSDLARALRRKHQLESDDTAGRATASLRSTQNSAMRRLAERRPPRSSEGYVLPT